MSARYFLETSMALAVLSRSQWWSPERLRKHQLGRLRKLLHHAALHVPIYRDRFAAHGLDVKTIRSLDDLPTVPILTREELNGISPEERLTQGLDPSKLLHLCTAGSSGQVLHIWVTRTQAHWRVGDIYRAYFANHYRLRDMLAIVETSPPAGSVLNRFGLLCAEHIPLDVGTERQAALLSEMRPDAIAGQSSVIARMADTLGRDAGLRPRVILCSTEELTEWRRHRIREAFGTDPANVYNSWEFGNIAWQCLERSGLHICSERLIVEVLPDGLFAITDLYNFSSPFIRYVCDDGGALSDTPCPCGRGLPTLAEIEGRRGGAKILLADGSAIFPVQYIMRQARGPAGVKELQIQQHLPGVIDLIVDTDGELAPLVAIAHQLENHLGLNAVHIVPEPERFARTPAGKQLTCHSFLPGQGPVSGSASGPDEPAFPRPPSSKRRSTTTGTP